MATKIVSGLVNRYYHSGDGNGRVSLALITKLDNGTIVIGSGAGESIHFTSEQWQEMVEFIGVGPFPTTADEDKQLACGA